MWIVLVFLRSTLACDESTLDGMSCVAKKDDFELHYAKEGEDIKVCCVHKSEGWVACGPGTNSMDSAKFAVKGASGEGTQILKIEGHSKPTEDTDNSRGIKDQSSSSKNGKITVCYTIPKDLVSDTQAFIYAYSDKAGFKKHQGKGITDRINLALDTDTTEEETDTSVSNSSSTKKPAVDEEEEEEGSKDSSNSTSSTNSSSVPPINSSSSSNSSSTEGPDNLILGFEYHEVAIAGAAALVACLCCVMIAWKCCLCCQSPKPEEPALTLTQYVNRKLTEDRANHHSATRSRRQNPDVRPEHAPTQRRMEALPDPPKKSFARPESAKKPPMPMTFNAGEDAKLKRMPDVHKAATKDVIFLKTFRIEDKEKKTSKKKKA